MIRLSILSNFKGLQEGKSLEGALSRIDFRINYGIINDVFDLAAMYAVAISQGHTFNDANKRTAYATMELCLHIHGEQIIFNVKEVGDVIIKVAQGHMDESELATWLRMERIRELEKHEAKTETPWREVSWGLSIYATLTIFSASVIRFFSIGDSERYLCERFTHIFVRIPECEEGINNISIFIRY